MKKYFRIMLSKGGSYAEECRNKSFIGLKADTKLKRALSVANNIDFYKYEIDFNLHKEI
jgi:hypothetical protein